MNNDSLSVCVRTAHTTQSAHTTHSTHTTHCTRYTHCTHYTHYTLHTLHTAHKTLAVCKLIHNNRQHSKISNSLYNWAAIVLAVSLINVHPAAQIRVWLIDWLSTKCGWQLSFPYLPLHLEFHSTALRLHPPSGLSQTVTSIVTRWILRFMTDAALI